MNSFTNSSLNEWLISKRFLVLSCIVFSSLLLRGWYFLDIKDTTLIRWHEWDQTDMSFFHTWADAIAEGDIWTNQRMRA